MEEDKRGGRASESSRFRLLSPDGLEEAEEIRASPKRFFSLSSIPGSSSDKDSRLAIGKGKDFLNQNAHTWLLFQEAAANTSKLYQARSAGNDGHWQNFQNAASAISLLYKESLDLQQRSYDNGYRAGVEKAYNELLEWLVKEPRYRSRKSIRTDDLINFVYSPVNPASFSAKLRPCKSAPSHSGLMDGSGDHQLGDLQTFRDALHVSSLNGAMSHFSVTRSPPRSSPSRSRPVDLHAFVTEEIRRHKRSSSVAFGLDDIDYDEVNSTASYKRSRFTPPK